MASDDQLTLEQIEAMRELPEQFKKGWRTSEFWQSAVMGLVPVAAFGAAIFGVDIDTEVLVGSMSAIVPSVVYVFSRGWVKRKRIEGMVGK